DYLCRGGAHRGWVWRIAAGLLARVHVRSSTDDAESPRDPESPSRDQDLPDDTFNPNSRVYRCNGFPAESAHAAGDARYRSSARSCRVRDRAGDHHSGRFDRPARGDGATPRRTRIPDPRWYPDVRHPLRERGTILPRVLRGRDPILPGAIHATNVAAAD